MVSPVSGCTTAAQKCSISTSWMVLLSALNVGLSSSRSLRVHVSSGASHTCLDKELMASCEIICGAAIGILLELGVVAWIWVSGATPGLSLGERLCGVRPLSMSCVAPGSLFLVCLWCVLGMACSVPGLVGSTVVVTSSEWSTLCVAPSPSEFTL